MVSVVPQPVYSNMAELCGGGMSSSASFMHIKTGGGGLDGGEAGDRSSLALSYGGNGSHPNLATECTPEGKFVVP